MFEELKEKSVKVKESKNIYDSFIRQAEHCGFTDDQADFIWDWVRQAVEYPQSFLHEDNYVKDEPEKNSSL